VGFTAARRVSHPARKREKEGEGGGKRKIKGKCYLSQQQLISIIYSNTDRQVREGGKKRKKGEREGREEGTASLPSLILLLITFERSSPHKLVREKREEKEERKREVGGRTLSNLSFYIFSPPTSK